MKKNWEYKKLGDVCSLIMGQSPDSSTYNESNGMPFFQGNADFGVLHPSVRVYCSAPVRIAQPNDILISVRAPIGALNIANKECCIGRGLAAVQPTSLLDNMFVYRFLTAVKDRLVAQGTGSTFKSIGKDALKNLEIPVPPMSEQERIVAELDLLNGVLEKQKAQLKELDTLAQSIFYDMFGDPIENPKGWDIDRLENLGYLGRGVSKHRPRNDPKLLGGSMPLIQTGDVANANYLIREYTSTYSDIGVAQSKVWPKGTLCITIAATIGKCAILDFEACFPDSVVGFTPGNKVCKDYIYFIFCNMQKMLEDYAPGVAQKNINLAILNALQIQVPPLSLQQAFADKIASIEKQKATINQSIAETQKLLDYTMDKYFG